MLPRHWLSNDWGDAARTRATAATLLLASAPAAAFSVNLGPLDLRIGTRLTAGAAMRVQDRSHDIVSLSNIPGQEALCYEGPYTEDPDNNPDTLPFDCGSPEGGLRLTELAGKSTTGLDNGNMNYDRGDLWSAPVKLTQTADFNLRLGDRLFYGKARYLAFYDAVNVDFDEFHQNTTYQPRFTPRAKAVEELIGYGIDLLDGYIGTEFLIGDIPLAVQVGKQIVNWGESSFITPYSLNAVAPVDVNRIPRPGSDPSEFFIPVNSIQINTELSEWVGLDAFYQFEFQPFVTPPHGSYLSATDPAGVGGTYTMLGLFIEDPMGLRRPGGPMGTTAALEGTISRSPRNLDRAFDADVLALSGHDPRGEESGNHGLRLRWFTEALGGTEFGFHYINQRSPLPFVSFVAAEASCLEDPSTVTVAVPGVGTVTDVPPCAAAAFLGQDFPAGSGERADQQTLPQNTMRYFFEYPDDVTTTGISFNTTVFDLSLQGEWAFRPDQPLQVHPTDLANAGLNPSVPEDGFILAGQRLIAPRRTIFPDDIHTNFRNAGPVNPRDYIRGYERLDLSQVNLQLTRLAPTNPFGAANWITVLELGTTLVHDMPTLADGLYLAVPGKDDHQSIGRADFCAREADGSIACADGARGLANLRQEAEEGFATASSWGYRMANILQYSSVFPGLNLQATLLWFHDVRGYAPGPGGNFIEGRKQLVTNLTGDYLGRWRAGARYVVYTGAGDQNVLRDRDFISAFIGYDF